MTSAPDGPPNYLPTVAVGRLSLYLRELQRLSDSGVTSANSRELARLIDVSPAIVRKDLSAIAAVGRRGVGYDISALIDRIGAMLGTQTHWNVILVGVGSLGTALLRYRGFQRQGFRIVGAFDLDPRLVGTSIGGTLIHPIADIGRIAKTLQPHLAVLAVPAEAAAGVAAELVAAGISGILNFAPMSLKLPRSVGVVNVDLASEMQRLAFAVSRLPTPPTAVSDSVPPPESTPPTAPNTRRKKTAPPT